MQTDNLVYDILAYYTGMYMNVMVEASVMIGGHHYLRNSIESRVISRETCGFYANYLLSGETSFSFTNSKHQTYLNFHRTYAWGLVN